MTSPQLPDEVQSALRDALDEFGVIVPIRVDAQGRVIEGGHRRRIADELGLSYDVQTITCPDDEVERARLARVLNADRRMVSTPQRHALVQALRLRGYSIYTISRALRISKDTVARDLDLIGSAPPLIHTRATPTPPRPPHRNPKFVSLLAEVTATCSSMTALNDLDGFLTPAEARQWQPSVSRALSGLRALQTRMKEHSRDDA